MACWVPRPDEFQLREHDQCPRKVGRALPEPLLPGTLGLPQEAALEGTEEFQLWSWQALSGRPSNRLGRSVWGRTGNLQSKIQANCGLQFKCGLP